MGNTFKTAFLLTALTLVLMFIGRAFGGQNGMVIALVLAAVMNFVAYFFSDKIALATYRAQPVTREELPRAYEAVERITQKVGLPMPKMYVIPTDSPNAFATGRNPQHASVAVTRGILNLLTDEELEGVLAHELGHVRNRDILISSIAATIAGAITMLASMGRWAMIFGGMGGRDDRDRGGGLAALFMLIVAPIAATLIQLAVSRSREYEADHTGANFTGNPYALASALKKLDTYSRRFRQVCRDAKVPGIRLHDVRHSAATMLHAKVMTVDGLVANIGSANFNPRSVTWDEEINVVAIDEPLARVLDSQFDEDLERSTEQKTSAVHFLRFELTSAHAAAFKAGTPARLIVDHPMYHADAELAPPTLAALAADLD